MLSKPVLNFGIFFAKKIVVRSVKLNPNIQTKSSTYCSYLRICILLLPANNEKVYVFSLSVNVRVAVPIFPLHFCENNIFYWCYIIPSTHTSKKKKNHYHCLSRGVTFTEVKGFLKDNRSVAVGPITSKEKRLKSRLPSIKRLIQ